LGGFNGHLLVDSKSLPLLHPHFKHLAILVCLISCQYSQLRHIDNLLFHCSLLTTGRPARCHSTSALDKLFAKSKKPTFDFGLLELFEVDLSVFGSDLSSSSFLYLLKNLRAIIVCNIIELSILIDMDNITFQIPKDNISLKNDIKKRKHEYMKHIYECFKQINENDIPDRLNLFAFKNTNLEIIVKKESYEINLKNLINYFSDIEEYEICTVLNNKLNTLK